MSQFHLPLHLQLPREMKRWTRETRRQNARTSARDCMCALAISLDSSCRVASSSDVERAGICLLAENCVAMCLASAVCGTLRRDKSPRFPPKTRKERHRQLPMHKSFFPLHLTERARPALPAPQLFTFRRWPSPASRRVVPPGAVS